MHIKNFSLNCEFCNKVYNTEKCIGENSKHHFCSKVCCNKWKIGKYLGGGRKKGCISNRKGCKHTEETKQKIREAREKQIIPPESYKKRILPSGSKHHNWAGNKVKYRALHYWIENKLGKPITCENCGKTNLSGHKIHWANISGKYKRNLLDWKRLCVSF